ncbi:MAG: hypothetical protein KGJ23_07570 [Euryarchaeota archaeon]|nr:hypothetical protein [Euryarchaeota archaeon]
MRYAAAAVLALLAALMIVPAGASTGHATGLPGAPESHPLNLPSNLFSSFKESCDRSSGSTHPSAGFPISIPAAGTGAAGQYNDTKLVNNTAVNATITAPSNPSLSTNQYVVLGVGDPVNATKFTAVAVAETFYVLATVAAPAAYLPNGTLIYNAANLVSLGSTHTYEINHVSGYWWKYTYDGNAITGSSAWENGTYNIGVSVAAGVMCEAGYTLGPSFVALAYGASGAATPTIPTTTVPWAVGVEPVGHSSPDYVPEGANAVPQINASLGTVGIQGHNQVGSLRIDSVKVGSSVPFPGPLVPLWGNYKVVILNQSSISPVSATIAFGKTQAFNATAFDENGAWIPKAHYHWAISPASLGTLNRTTGSTVLFTAGSSQVSGRIWANVSYNCSTIHDEANITVALVGAPTIENFDAWHPKIVLGDTTQFFVNASWPLPATLTYTYTGLPAGCLTQNVTVLSCTPTQLGFFPVRVYVNDTNTHSSSAVVTLPALNVYADLVVSALSFTPSTLTWGTWTSVATTVAGGVPPLTYDYQGAPTGCDGGQPATFNCDPKSNGTYQGVVFVNDSAGHSGTATASITVHVPIAITGFNYSSNPVSLGATTTINITANGGTPPYGYAYLSLPPGCTSSNTRSLSCTPSSTGSYTPKVNVTDSSGAWAVAASPLTVSAPAPLTISSFQANPNPVVVSHSTNFTVSASGGSGTLHYSYAGLPTGCVSANQAVLPCVPTQVGTANVTVTVSDAASHSATKWLNLVVSASGAPTITAFTATPNAIQLGSTTAIAVTASGSGTLAYGYTGMPAGCSSSLASFSCTPTVTGTFTLRVYVNNSVSFATQTTSLQVTPVSSGGLSITSFSALPSSVPVGSTSDLSVSATGGTGALSYSYTGLPSGCASASSAALACAPNVAGTFTIRVFVNDTAGHSVNAVTTLTVTAPTTPAGTSTGLWLPLVAILAIAAVAVLAALLYVRRRKKAIANPPPPMSAVPPEPAPAAVTPGPTGWAPPPQG